MALTAVLIHRGRLVKRSASGRVVEGTKLRGPDEHSEWFKCRLFPQETPETPGSGSGRRVLSRSPHVMVGPKDVARNLIEVGDISPGKVIEIEGGVLGSQRWEISGEPEALQPRSNKILGFYFVVRRVEESP